MVAFTVAPSTRVGNPYLPFKYNLTRKVTPIHPSIQALFEAHLQGLGSCILTLSLPSSSCSPFSEASPLVPLASPAFIPLHSPPDSIFQAKCPEPCPGKSSGALEGGGLPRSGINL